MLRDEIQLVHEIARQVAIEEIPKALAKLSKPEKKLEVKTEPEPEVTLKHEKKPEPEPAPVTKKGKKEAE